MPESKTYNCNCMDYMKTVPDKYFDLAVVDTPYGDGSSQNVQVERERERESKGQATLGSELTVQGLAVDLTNTIRQLTALVAHGHPSMRRRSFHGMLHQVKNILMNSFVSQKTKSYGVEIILNFLRQDVFLFGEN